MRTICYTCPGYGLKELEKPQMIFEDDVLVRIAYAGICGSDINIIHGHEDDFLGINPGDTYVLGHEASGYVEALGKKANTKGLKVGDKVALYFNQYCGKCYYCRNAQEQFCENVLSRGGFFADYAVVNEQQVFLLPDNTDMRKAALVEPISVVQRGIDLLNLKPGIKVAIIGGGSVGLIFTELLHTAGAVRITVIEPVANKRTMALESGADYALDPNKEDMIAQCMQITERRGFDVVVETSGVRSAIQAGYDILGRGGTLELFASYGSGAVYPLDLPSFFAKEAKVIGVFQSPYMYPRAIELFNRLELDPFIEHIYQPEEWKEAFEFRMSGGPQKVLFEFHKNQENL